MKPLLLILALLFAGCTPPITRFHAGDLVEVKVDHRHGVIEQVYPWEHLYVVRLHSIIIGYRVITMTEAELEPAKP